MSRLWRWVLPCYLFTVPMTMAGFVIATLFYRAHSWRWYDGVLTCIAGSDSGGNTLIWGQPNAQTLGWVTIFDTEQNWNEPDLRVHEFVHVVQAFAGSLLGLALCPLLVMCLGWSPWVGLVLGGFVGGLGFAILYGLLFLCLYLKGGEVGWYHAYRANPFEVQAYAVQDKFLDDTNKGTHSSPWGV